MKIPSGGYSNYDVAKVTQEYQAGKTVAKATEKTEKAVEAGATVEISAAGQAAGAAGAAVSVKSRASEIAGSVKKMSEADRAALTDQLNADAEARKTQMLNMVRTMMGQQVDTLAKSDEDYWRFLAKGKYTVDPETKAQAQKDIAEDGYYGVKQTSERMFQFALALSGGDETKMKEMQKAFDKGYKQAEKTWGQELPEISKQTYDATNKLFEDYYAGLQSAPVETN